MAGVDSIIKEILDEAEANAASIRQKASDEAKAAMADASASCAVEAKTLRENAARQADAYAERITSRIGMLRRESVLRTKQALIEETIEAAYEKLKNADDASYFAMIETLAERELQGEDGVIIFGENDLKRLPKGFADRLAEAAKKKGGTVTLSKEAGDIENGFILRYGGIDENCTLKALFSQKKEQLQDTVMSILW